MKKKVLVLFGGVSSEHDVSLQSAASVIKNIPADKYDIVTMGITKDGRCYIYNGSPDMLPCEKWLEDTDNLEPAVISTDRSHHGIIRLNNGVRAERIDVTFPVLHGKNGEDGTVQGLLELADIPYCGCKILASAACMDKVYANIIFDQMGIERCRWDFIRSFEADDIDAVEARMSAKFGYPMFVKPSRSGSSVGISKVCNKDEMRNAINTALAHDDKVVFEEFVEGHEVECAVYGNIPELVASEVGEIGATASFYDYDDKYKNGTSRTFIPASVNEDIRKDIREIAKKAYTALNCAGLSRVDFFVEKGTNRILINEINTLPGFTTISMYPKLMQYEGMTYSELVDGIIQLGLKGSK